MNNIYKSIAIDGPAASGKSVVGKQIAEKLSYIFLDTGLMYRAVTYISINKKINPINVSEFFSKNIINLNLSDSKNIINYEKNNITSFLFSNEIDSNVSNISKLKEVRQNLVKEQKEISKSNNIVMVGRDIGTKVLPNANLKIYLDASIEIRALRRSKELNGLSTNIIEEKIKNRDVIDKNRVNSPLKLADDAIIINTDTLTINQVVSNIIELSKQYE
ncbi:MAG: (d)CMP kinase [Dehalococcoidales bacterium]|nr:(d)CMP kinase [Dehalococcoidia bacterium]NCG35127.1 (d)CMP kinase [Dehalococcoidales bacterium]